MPIFTSPTGWPRSSTAVPGWIVSVSFSRCASVSCGAAEGSLAAMTVVWVALTCCITLVGTRGR